MTQESNPSAFELFKLLLLWLKVLFIIGFVLCVVSLAITIIPRSNLSLAFYISIGGFVAVTILDVLIRWKYPKKD
jgi:hypothetical protein